MASTLLPDLPVESRTSRLPATDQPVSSAPPVPPSPVPLRIMLVRNTFWYGCVTVLGLASGLLMSIMLARTLGPARMGDFSYVVFVMRILESVATLGFAMATVRYTAEAFGRGEPRLATGFLKMFLRAQLVSTTIVALVVTPLALALAPADLHLAYGATILTLFPLTLEGIYIRATYGAQRYDFTAQVSTVKMVLTLLATAAALALGTGLSGVFVAQGLVVAVSCALQQRRARSVYPTPAAAVPAAALSEVRSYVLPLSAVMLLQMLVWDRGELFLLRLYVPSDELGFYSLAFGLAARVMLLTNIIVGPLMPVFATLHGRGDREEFNRVYRQAIRYAALVGTPIVAIGVALAPALIVGLYGAAYAPVAWMFSVLVVVTLVGALRDVAWPALQGAGAKRSILVASVICTVIGLGLAVLLIPSYGTLGAVVASATAKLTLSVWAFAAIAIMKGARLPVTHLVKIAAAGAAAYGAAAVTHAHSPVAPIPLAVAAGVAAFLVMGVLLEELGWEEGRRVIGLVTQSLGPGRVIPGKEL